VFVLWKGTQQSCRQPQSNLLSPAIYSRLLVKMALKRRLRIRFPSRLVNGGQERSGKLGLFFKRTWIEDGQCVFVLCFLQVL
jgi:hypothetical protein